MRYYLSDLYCLSDEQVGKHLLRQFYEHTDRPHGSEPSEGRLQESRSVPLVISTELPSASLSTINSLF